MLSSTDVPLLLFAILFLEPLECILPSAPVIVWATASTSKCPQSILSDSGSMESLLVHSFPFEQWTVLVAVTRPRMVEGDRSPGEKEFGIVAENGEYTFLEDGSTAVIMRYGRGRNISIGELQC